MRACVRVLANEHSEMLARILHTEAQDDVSRSKIYIKEENGELRIAIEAEDVVALRAALNSYLRWTKLAIDAKEVMGG